MQFLKNCITSLQVVDGFACIHYRVYCFGRENSSSNNEQSSERKQRIRDAIFLIRKRGGLVTYIPTIVGFYTFGKTELEAHQTIQPVAAAIDASEPHSPDTDLALMLLLSGSFKCSDILDDATGWSKATIGVSHRSQSPWDINAKVVQSNGHAIAESSSESLYESANLAHLEVFRFFISAVVESISFRVACGSDMLPLNFRTYINRPICNTEVGDPNNLYSIVAVPVQLTAIDVQLTATGKLLFSTTSRRRLRIQQIHHFIAEQEARDLSGQPVFVRIAPNGAIAKLLYKKLRTNTHTGETTENQLWRTKVQAWLGGKGISLDGLDQDSCWESILLLISGPKFGGAVSQQNPSKEVVVEWPTSLCLCYATLELSGSDVNPGSRDGLNQDADDARNKWFQTSTNHGFKDPIDFALDWLTGKSKSDGEMEVRHARSLGEESMRKYDEELGCPPVDVPSSSNLRAALFGDHQAAGTMYPTPPEGLLSQTATGDSPMETGIRHASQQFDSRQSSTANTSYTDDSRLSDIANGTSNNIAPTYFIESKSEINTYDNNHKDFEDIGITDADFNFFDEPDLDVDIEMLEAPSNTPETQKDLIQPRTRTIHKQIVPAMGAETEIQQLHQGLNMTNTVEVVQQPNGNQSSNISESYTTSALCRSLSTPPLSPLFIRHSLIQAPSPFFSGQRDISHPYRRENNLGAVAFNPEFDISDKKYRLHGRFGYAMEHNSAETFLAMDSSNIKVRPSEVPTLGWRPIKNPRRSRRGHGTSRVEHHTDITTGDKCTSSHDNKNNACSPHSGRKTGRSTPSSFLFPTSKRRRRSVNTPPSLLSERATGGTSNNGGSSKSDLGDGSLSNSPAVELLLLERCFEPNAADRSLLNSPLPEFNNHSNGAAPFPIFGGDDYVASAQLVVEQMALSTLNQIAEVGSKIRAMDVCFDGAIKPPTNNAVQEAILEIFPSATLLNLPALALNHGTLPKPAVPGKLQPRPVLRRSNTPNTYSSATKFGAEPIFAIPPPFVRLQKTDAIWDMMPTAISFWETLGLGPASGPKNILAWCIYPFSDGLESHIVRFLDTIESTYRACKLGIHARGHDTSDFQHGLVPVRVASRASLSDIMEGVREIFTRLGSQLSGVTTENENILIYMINPFKEPAAIHDLCACFLGFVRTYNYAVAHMQKTIPVKCGLVLQIVPIEFVVSFETSVFIDPSSAAKLAREVYDRCPATIAGFGKTDLRIPARASIELEKPLPKVIHFQLIETPPPNVLLENSCFHIAYCQSSDERWVTAAWIDNTGKYQATASYCLNGVRKFIEVAREIWETTVEFIQPRKVTWRLFLVKAGAMSKDEVAVWLELTASSKATGLYRLSLLSTNTAPLLDIIPKSPEATDITRLSPVSQSADQAVATNATPITTPQPFIPSPAPTPPSTTPLPADNLVTPDTDPSARLIDLTDESWGIILPYHLNVSNSLIHYNPSLASGYLIKRAGVSNFDAPVTMEVNLMYCSEDIGPGESTQKWFDGILREVLIMYRGLGLLARLRGMEGVMSVKPWHIALVEKGVEGLRLCTGPLSSESKVDVI